MNKKKLIKYLLIAIGVLIPLGVIYYFFIYVPSQENIARAGELVGEAKEYVEDQYYFLAVEKYQEAEEIDGGNYEIYSGLAEVYLLKNREDSAVEILQVGVNKSRQSSEMYGMLGEIYLNDGNYSRAIYFLESAVKKDKDNDLASFQLAQAYVGAGDFEKSSRKLDISDDDYNLYVRAKLLDAMLLGDDVEEAEDIIDDLDLSDVGDDVADEVDFFKDVLGDIDNLDDEYKTDVYVSVMVSRAALFSEYPDLVIGILSDYLSEYELYWELNLYLGHAYLMKGDYENAVEYLQNAYVLDSDDPIGVLLLARAHMGRDDESEMIKYYEKAINLSDDETNIRHEYFDVLLSKEQYARAEEQEIILLLSDDIDSDYLQLVWCSSLLDRELYSQLQNKIEQIDVDWLDDDLKPEYYYLNAGVSYGNGEWDKAEEFVQHAVELDEKEAKYHLLYGRILYQTGMDSEALVELERTVELDLEGKVSAEATKTLDRI